MLLHCLYAIQLCIDTLFCPLGINLTQFGIQVFLSFNHHLLILLLCHLSRLQQERRFKTFQLSHILGTLGCIFSIVLASWGVRSIGFVYTSTQIHCLQSFCNKGVSIEVFQIFLVFFLCSFINEVWSRIVSCPLKYRVRRWCLFRGTRSRDNSCLCDCLCM